MIRVVHIQWHDAAAAPGWHDQSQLAAQLEQPPTLCDTIGMLVERKNKDKVTVVQTVGQNETTGVFEIPRSCIRSVKTLCTLPITIEV
jgi:hypothetical protein